jgi:hypothetical protein
MSWQDRYHERSEKKAQELQSIEDRKIIDKQVENGKMFKEIELKGLLYNVHHKVTIGCRSDEHRFDPEGYSIDTYCLTKFEEATGYILKFYSLSPTMFRKYKFYIDFPSRVFFDRDFIYPSKNNPKKILNDRLPEVAKDRLVKQHCFLYRSDFPQTVRLTYHASTMEEPDETETLSLIVAGFIDNGDLLELFCLLPNTKDGGNNHPSS